METEGRVSSEVICRALADMGPKEALRVPAMVGCHGKNIVHRLVSKLDGVFGGRPRVLFMLEDLEGKALLMMLIDRDAADFDIFCFFDAALDPDAFIKQPAGQLSIGLLPLQRAAAHKRLGACRANLATAAFPQALFEFGDFFECNGPNSAASCCQQWQSSSLSDAPCRDRGSRGSSSSSSQRT